MGHRLLAGQRFRVFAPFLLESRNQSVACGHSELCSAVEKMGSDQGAPSSLWSWDQNMEV